MKSLRILAGPVALQYMRQSGLQAQDVGVIPGAAGGPKGLILGPLDRHLFGTWLPQSTQPVHLVGASIGAWRLASACLNDPAQALHRLEHDYIHQDYPIPAGQKRPSAEQVSRQFKMALQSFYGGRVNEILSNPRFHLHVMTSHGRDVLSKDGPWRTPAGYAMAYVANAMSRPWLGHFLERVVFSSHMDMALPFQSNDFRTHRVPLTQDNFMPALQASCSIPFVLQAVHDIPHAPRGAYWDGGITDYHLHLDYRANQGLVLYPHFQPHVVPGWLDKALRWRHPATSFLNRMVLLCPKPEWVAQLPQSKLPDRTDFLTHAHDVPQRIKVWQTAVSQAQQLADEWQAWLQQPDLNQVEPLP